MNQWYAKHWGLFRELLWKSATWMKLIFLILVEGSSAGGPISWRRLQFGLLPQNWGLTASTAAYCLLSGSTKQPSRYIRILRAACLILKDQDAHIVFKDGLVPSKRTSLHFQYIQYNITNVLQQRTSALLFESFVKSFESVEGYHFEHCFPQHSLEWIPFLQ